jgi:hypothetical protein
MVMYATPTELAGRMQQDLDTYSATQALTLASGEFSVAADMWFVPTAVTWTTDVHGETLLRLPYRAVTAVSAVRVNGVVVTGWSLRNGRLYRAAGFGSWSSLQPDAAEIDLTHGLTAATDDVKRAVLDMAAADYESPVKVASERVDDYQVTYYTGTPIAPSGRSWREVALSYRGIAVA